MKAGQILDLAVGVFLIIAAVNFYLGGKMK